MTKKNFNTLFGIRKIRPVISCHPFELNKKSVKEFLSNEDIGSCFLETSYDEFRQAADLSGAKLFHDSMNLYDGHHDAAIFIDAANPLKMFLFVADKNQALADMYEGESSKDDNQWYHDNDTSGAILVCPTVVTGRITSAPMSELVSRILAFYSQPHCV